MTYYMETQRSFHMAHNFKDRTGEQFHWLKCLYPVRDDGKALRWMCSCSCGELVSVMTSKLLNGDRKSCSKCRSLRMGKSRTIPNPVEIIGNDLSVGVGSRSYPCAKMLIDKKDRWVLECESGSIRVCKPAADLLYACKQVDGKRVMVHRLISGASDGDIVDHISGDTLDNRPENLRKTTRLENNRNCCIRKNNKSGKMGVTLNKKSGKWQVRIGSGSTRIHLGAFDDLDMAIKRREEAEKECGYHENHGRSRDYFPPKQNKVQLAP